jgi:hypothetical protein
MLLQLHSQLEPLLLQEKACIQQHLAAKRAVRIQDKITTSMPTAATEAEADDKIDWKAANKMGSTSPESLAPLPISTLHTLLGQLRTRLWWSGFTILHDNELPPADPENKTGLGFTPPRPNMHEPDTGNGENSHWERRISVTNADLAPADDMKYSRKEDVDSKGCKAGTKATGAADANEKAQEDQGGSKAARQRALAAAELDPLVKDSSLTPITDGDSLGGAGDASTAVQS